MTPIMLMHFIQIIMMTGIRRRNNQVHQSSVKWEWKRSCTLYTRNYKSPLLSWSKLYHNN